MKKLEFEKLLTSGSGLRAVEEKVAEAKAARLPFQDKPVTVLNNMPITVADFIQQDTKFVEIGSVLDKDILVRAKMDEEFSRLPVANMNKIDDFKKSLTFAQVAIPTSPWISGFFFQHANYGGKFYYLFNSGDSIYYKIPKLNSLNDSISSLKVLASKLPVEVYLFQNENFEGRYQRFVCPANKVKELTFIGNYMNDRTSSILIVRRRKNEYCIDLTSKLVPAIKDQVKNTKDIYPRGEPVVKWDLSSSNPLVYIEIPVEIEVPNWVNYDGVVKYWINLYLTNQGKLAAYISRYGWSVEGGMFTSCIVDKFKDRVRDAVPALNTKINDFVKIAAPFTFKSLYLLPSDHQQGEGLPTCENPVDETGETKDGVSLILSIT
jgi:hypothetical protein